MNHETWTYVDVIVPVIFDVHLNVNHTVSVIWPERERARA
jgi:hypothetical protein